MHIGVLGGTFDPLHIGHLIIAEESRIRLGLKKVLFVPAGKPWMKSERNITPAVHRVEMVRLAIMGNPYFELCTREVERAEVSYTVDTLTELLEEQSEAEFLFILGQDALARLPSWKEPERLVKVCYLIAVPRQDTASPSLSSLEASIPGISSRVFLLDTPLIGISSTDIRQRAARGLSLRYLVPPEVEKYIRRHGLYMGMGAYNEKG